MRSWQRYDTRTLTPAQEQERTKLGLDSPCYRLYLFIREAGVEGVSWGSLPASASARLLATKLIWTNGVVVRAKEYAR